LPHEHLEAPTDRREPGQLRRDSVVSDPHRETEIAALIRGGYERVARFGIGRRYGHSRQDAAGRIRYGADHCGILRVPRDGQRDDHPEYERSEDTPRSHGMLLSLISVFAYRVLIADQK